MLSPAQIVAVAKDVIAQIKGEKIIAFWGTYIQFQDRIDEHAANQLFDLQDITKTGLVCNVCARGALIMSKAKLYNDCKFGDAEGRDYGSLSIYGSVEKFSARDFPFEIYGRVEVAFEGRDVTDGDYRERMGEDDYQACRSFHRKYQDGGAKALMLAIMRNIIRNGGREFRPKGIKEIA